MEDFEVFGRRRARSVKTPLVTIQMRGNFSFNNAAYQALGQAKAIEFLFSRSRRVIGFRKVDPSVPSAYPLKKQGNSDNFVASGRTFTQDYDIDTSVARRYRAELRGDMLIVDLKEPGTIATGPRAGTGRSDAIAGTQRRRLARHQDPFTVDDDTLEPETVRNQDMVSTGDSSGAGRQADLERLLRELQASLHPSGHRGEVDAAQLLETIYSRIGDMLERQQHRPSDMSERISKERSPREHR